MRPINRKFCGLLTANYSTRIIQKTTVRLSTASASDLWSLDDDEEKIRYGIRIYPSLQHQN